MRWSPILQVCALPVVSSTSLALHLQMRCKITTKNNSLQISTPVACKFLLNNYHVHVKKYWTRHLLPVNDVLTLSERGIYHERSTSIITKNGRTNVRTVFNATHVYSGRIIINNIILFIIILRIYLNQLENCSFVCSFACSFVLIGMFYFRYSVYFPVIPL